MSKAVLIQLALQPPPARDIRGCLEPAQASLRVTGQQHRQRIYVGDAKACRQSAGIKLLGQTVNLPEPWITQCLHRRQKQAGRHQQMSGEAVGFFLQHLVRDQVVIQSRPLGNGMTYRDAVPSALVHGQWKIARARKSVMA